MKANVGGVDKIVRVVLGIALILWAVLGSGPAHKWGWVGVIPLATGLFSFCGLYTLIGVNTCPAPASKE